MNQNFLFQKHRPLQDYALLCTQSVSEALSYIERYLSPHRISINGSECGVKVIYDRVQLDGLSIVYVDYSESVTVTTENKLDNYLIQTKLSGHGVLASRGAELTLTQGDSIILSPSDTCSTTVERGSTRLLTQIDPMRLKHHLSTLINQSIGEDIVFELGVIKQREYWLTLLDNILTQIIRMPSILKRPAIIQSYSDLLLTSLLEFHHHNYWERLNTPKQKLLPQAFKRLLEYIEENVREPLTPSRLAKHAGVSIRSLQRDFKRYLGKSPGQHLQDSKLIAINHELKNSYRDKNGVITPILLKYGITDFGRFAQRYRKRFGCTPTETLK